VYGIFPGKEDLYRAIHRANLDELARAMRRSPDAASVRETLLARSELSTRFLTSRPDYLRIYLSEASAGASIRRAARRCRAFVDLALFERGVRNGELVDEDPQLLQSLVLASGQVHLAHWLRSGMREDPAALVGADPGVRPARDLPRRARDGLTRVSPRALVIGGTGPTGPFIVNGLRARGYATAILHRGTHEIDEIPPTSSTSTPIPTTRPLSSRRWPRAASTSWWRATGGCARSRACARDAPSASSASAAFRSTAAGCASKTSCRAAFRCRCPRTRQGREREASCARAS
jgi:hypothetical protein